MMIMAPVVFWAEDDHEAYEDEDAGSDESAKFGFGVEVLDQEAAAYEDEDQPGAASEVIAKAEEEADGDEEDVPAEEPVRERETHLVEEEYAAYQEQEEAGPEAARSAT